MQCLYFYSLIYSKKRTQYMCVCVCVLPPYLAGIYNCERKSPETSRLLGFFLFV